MTNARITSAPAFQVRLFEELQPTLRVEPKGVVFTKPWVVELILDLAGFKASADLSDQVAIEPAAGDGAFVAAMVRRLIESCRLRGKSINDAASALIAYELNDERADRTRQAAVSVLTKSSIEVAEAEMLAHHWIRTGNYLSDSWKLPNADFVIGNPPYVRLEDIDPKEVTAYRGAFPTMKGRADLYVAFFEAALRQLKPNGVCAFICADRWMLNQYGSELRRLITSNYGVQSVIEMHKARAFEDSVDAYPAVTVIRRAKQGPVVVASAGAGVENLEPSKLSGVLQSVHDGTSHELPPAVRAARVEAWFQNDDPWPSVPPERLSLLKRLESEFETIESVKTKTKVGIGVATGLDKVFITSDPNVVEASRLLPLAMASDTRQGQMNWTGHFLINPWDVNGLVTLRHYPQLSAFFEHHRIPLAGRNVARRNPTQWYRTIDRVMHDLLAMPKLYIPDIKGRIHPVLDLGQTYPHHNLYVVSSNSWDLEVLGGLLLSAVAQFFIDCYALKMRGGYLRFQAQYLRRIRVPDPKEISAVQALALRDAFHRRDVQAANDIAGQIYKIEAIEDLDCAID